MSRDLFRFLHLISGQLELNMKSSDCWAHDLCATFHCPFFLFSSFFICLNISSSQHILILVHIFSTLQSPPTLSSHTPYMCSLKQPHIPLAPCASLLNGPRNHIMSWEPLFALCTWFHVLMFFRKLLSHSLLNDMEKKVTLVCSKGEQWTWDAQSWGS